MREVQAFRPCWRRTSETSSRSSLRTWMITAEIDQQENGAVNQLKLRREREPDVRDRCKSGDNERSRRGDALLLVPVLPNGAHAHRVLADRNGDAEGWTEFHADGFHGGIE